MTPSPFKALFYSFICALLFGSAFPAIKTVFGHWESRGLEIGLFSIWLFAGIRFMIAGIGLLCAAKQPFIELKNTPWRLLLLFTLGQTLLQYLFFYLGVYVSSGSLAALLAGSGSFWWMILAPVILKTPLPTRLQWAAVIFGFIGVALAVYSPGTGASNPLLGAVLILTSTLFGSIGIIIFSKIKPTMGSKAGSGFALLFGGGALFLIGSPAISELPQLFDAKIVLLTLWLAFVSAMGFALWNHLSTIYPVSLLASYRFLIPLCGVVESLIILKSESPGIGLLIGGPMILVSIYIAQKFQKRSA
ncbi:MAG: DMT family transporter [Rubritalea sp.]|jgi:drug/metabolite transporter (DMT)-like permease|tara:strand:+ start:2267 stop:3178 length:912 start_codon:yes stop_codon:yes gene_type:complete